MQANVTELGAHPWLPALRWASLARAATAGLFGVLALVAPEGGAMDNILLAVGLYLLVDGGLAVFEGLQRMTHSARPFLPYVIEGIISLGTGLLALIGSRFVGLVFLALAVRCLAIGVAEVLAGRQLCRDTGKTSTWSTWMAGAASLVVGIGLLLEPAIDMRVKMLLLGVYGLVFAASLLSFFAETGSLGRPQAGLSR